MSGHSGFQLWTPHVAPEHRKLRFVGKSIPKMQKTDARARDELMSKKDQLLACGPMLLDGSGGFSGVSVWTVLCRKGAVTFCAKGGSSYHPWRTVLRPSLAATRGKQRTRRKHRNHFTASKQKQGLPRSSGP